VVGHALGISEEPPDVVGHALGMSEEPRGVVGHALGISEEPRGVVGHGLGISEEPRGVVGHGYPGCACVQSSILFWPRPIPVAPRPPVSYSPKSKRGRYASSRDTKGNSTCGICC
jgi:hypothetical protein